MTPNTVIHQRLARNNEVKSEGALYSDTHLKVVKSERSVLGDCITHKSVRGFQLGCR